MFLFVVNWMTTLMETKGPGMDLSMHEAITAGPDTAKQYFLGTNSTLQVQTVLYRYKQYFIGTSSALQVQTVLNRYKQCFIGTNST